MNLFRLSRFIALGCMVSLSILLIMTAYGMYRLTANQAVLEQLVQLHDRIDQFNARSDQILLQGAEPELWRAYVGEASAISSALNQFDDRHPDARRAADRVTSMTRAVANAVGARATDPEAPDAGQRFEGLEVPAASRIAMREIADEGVALDVVLAEALQERRGAISAQITWIYATLACAALLFGLLCMLGFGLIHKRIAQPIRSLAFALERINAGNSEARLPEPGNNELARLSRAMNRLLDEQQATHASLRTQQMGLKTDLSDLKAMADRLVVAQQLGNIGSWEADPERDRLICSEQVFAILGVEGDDSGFTEKAFLERVHQKDRERLQQCRAACKIGGEVAAEYRIVRPNGELRWIFECARVVAGGDNLPQRMTGTIQDVTERYHEQERLHQLHEVMEQTGDLCGVIDSTYRFQWVNRRYAELYGLSKSELEGHTLREVLGAEVFDSIKPRIDQGLAGEPQRFATDRELPDVGVRHLLVRYYPIDTPGKRARSLGFLLTDVTEIRAVEAALSQHAQLLEVAGKAARFGGWSVDLKSGKVDWSNLVAEIHAKPPSYSPTIDEAIAFYSPEYRDRIREVFTACAELGRPYDEQLQIIDAEGFRHWIRTTGEPKYDANGTIVQVQGALQDITERKELEHQNQGLTERLATMLESITDGFTAFDANWRYVYINEAGARMLGKPSAELLEASIWSQFPDLAGTQIEAALHRAMEEREFTAVEEFFEPLGKWFDLRVYPWEGGVAAFFLDVTETHDMLEQLKAQDTELRDSRDELDAALSTLQALINSLPAHIALLDAEGRVIDVNERWRLYGTENANLDPTFGIGMNYLTICETTSGESSEGASSVAVGLREVLAGDRESFTLEYPCHSPNEQRWFRVMFNRLTADRSVPSGAVAMHVDVTERKLAEQQLERVAYEDPLTELLSRGGFEQALEGKVQSLGWQSGDIIAMLDMVNLRDINDVHGYDKGDRLLIEVGKRLQANVPENGFVGRTGGDEFIAYLPADSMATREERMSRLANTTDEAFDLDGTVIEIKSRVSYTELGEVRRSVEDLIREAEIALFEIRDSAHVQSRWLGFSEEMAQRGHDRIQLSNELRQALQADEFELHLQPKVNLTDGSLISAEALIRWQHPVRGLQPPGRFIPVAEQSQLIGPIGDWALREACRLLREWLDAKLDIVRVSVNVSVVQFQLGDFPAKVKAVLNEFGILPSQLSLEITESVFERQSDKLQADIQLLHDMGVQLSLDDFGTGYSSLMYLQRYPFDEVKIDRAFVSGLLDNNYSREIVLSVMTMASALGADVVAEGIESLEIAQALLDLGCKSGQGFYYSVPLEAEDFRWLLEQHSTLPISASKK